jgi:HTH-type transcriptional regulator, glycine betaine synthesis regulator
MTDEVKREFIDGMSCMSQFWGFPKGMGAIFAVLYLSSEPLSLDVLVSQTGLTKGAVSTNIRILARLGLVKPVSRLADRKDYYQAETDFYAAIQAILKERRNSEFDRAVSSVNNSLEMLKSNPMPEAVGYRAFLVERLEALQAFFNAIDSLTRAVTRLDRLGINTVQTVLKTLK